MEIKHIKTISVMSKIFQRHTLLLLLFCSSAFIELIEAKVLIITHNYNRPDFTEIQVQTFKKFVKDDYEFVVFNNASDRVKRQEIRNVCKKHNLRCIEIPQEIHDRPYLVRKQGENKSHPCCRVANCIQYSLDVLGFQHDDIVVIIDTDMFLTKPFSFRDFMNGYDLAGVPQLRGPVTYFWQGLIMFNMRTLPDKNQFNFNLGYVEGHACDVGGYSHYYLKSHPQVKVRFFANHIGRDQLLCKDCQGKNKRKCSHYTKILQLRNFDPELIKLIQDSPYWSEYYLNGTFLHYGSGTNWDNKSPEYHIKKTGYVKIFIDSILQKKQI